jgi:hypothetical protein
MKKRVKRKCSRTCGTHEDDERRKFLREQPEFAKGHLQRSDQFGTVFRGLLLGASAATGFEPCDRVSLGGGRAEQHRGHHPEERSVRH